MGKQVQINYAWRWIELNEEERNKALDELLDSNINELKRIIKRLSNERIDVLEFKDVVAMLFDKQATASFTKLQDVLGKKIFDIKENRYGNKSLIDKAFEGVSSEEKNNKNV